MAAAHHGHVRVPSSICCLSRLLIDEAVAFPGRLRTRGVRSPDDGNDRRPAFPTDHDLPGEVVLTCPTWRFHAGIERCDGFAASSRQASGAAGRRDRDGRLGLPVGAGLLVRVGEVMADSRASARPARPSVTRLNRSLDAALRGVVSGPDLDIEWPAPGPDPAVLARPATPSSSASHLGEVRQAAGAAAGRMASQGSAGPAGSRADLRARRRLGARGSPTAGLCADVTLAELGWVCLSVQYRVSPHHRWPSHITDVKTAVAWARANVDKFGGDRNFIAVAGCSAGGHLSALAGLTANDPEMQTELPPGSDTAVDAVVGIYGRYDWEDRSTTERDAVRRFPRASCGQAQDRPPS